MNRRAFFAGGLAASPFVAGGLTLPDGDAYLPTGEFRFETRYAGARDRSEGIGDREWSGACGFALAVE